MEANVGTKICKKCGVAQEAIKFPKGNTNRNCLACLAKYQREYNQRNNEVIKETLRRSYKKHQEKRTEEKRVAYSENKDVFKDRVQKYYELNKDKKAEYSLEYSKSRRKRDPEFRIRCILRTQLRNAIKAVSTKRANHTFNLLGITVPEFLEYLKSKFTEGMTLEKLGKEIHIDHIRPCASFDLTDPEQQKLCFHYTNLQPLWAKDNLIKNSNYNGTRHTYKARYE